MKANHLYRAVAASAVLALGLTACGGGSSNDKADSAPQEHKLGDYNPQPRENLKQGGEVHFPVVDIPEQMNTNNSDGDAYGAKIWEWGNPQVMLMSPEGEASPNPAYLSDYKVEKKGGKTVATYTINPKAVWNDGSPIDWTAFKTSWVAQRDDSKFHPNSTDGYSQIESVEQGKDAKQAVVTFKKVFPWVDGLFWHLVNPHVNTPKKFNEAYINNPHPEWGAGPYKVKKYDAKKHTISFVPNEKWWGNKPLLDKVTFTQMESTAAINAFNNGEVDTTSYISLTADDIAKVKSTIDSGDAVLYRSTDTANALIQLNAETPGLDDIDVRKALFEGINREALKKLAFKGLNYTEPPAGSLNLYSYQDGYVDALAKAGYKYDPENAKKLLEGAGWKLDEKTGVRTKGKDKLEFDYPIFGDNPITKARAQLTQNMLKQIGIKINIVQKADADFAKVVTTKDWDLIYMGFTSSDPYGVEWMCQLYCSNSGLNLSGTGTKAIDKEIQDKVASLPTQEAQTKAGMKLETEIIKKTWGVLPVLNGPVIKAARKGLANLDPEVYTGVDGFGVHPVEDMGWEKK